MTSEAAPEQKLHAVEARIEQAANDGGTNPEQLVQWRQECLALAQLACRADTGTPDKYQLGRACANLAAAYLASGATEAALRHAERAEALLLSDADRTEAAASLLPDVLHMLATSHAELGKYRRAAEYFNRALAASNTIYGKGHVRCCPVRQHGQSALARSSPCDHPQLQKPTRLLGAALWARNESPRRIAAVERPWRPGAPAPAHSLRLLGHSGTPSGFLQVLRGWARMAVQREQDHTLAVQLLRKEMDVREAHMGRDPSADERAELVSLLQELAEMLLAAARQAEARSKLVAGGGRGGGSAAKGGAVAGKPRSKEARAAEARRAAELRDEAAELLRAKARIGGAAGDTSPALTEEAANMAIKLGQACSELGQWAQAEGAYLCALPWLEERHGMSDGGVIKLWAEVARLRMRQAQA